MSFAFGEIERVAREAPLHDSESALVSVAIPVYNGQATVAETLRSVLSQTYRKLEIIVVDDGSTDRTWEILESFGDSIRAIRQPNGGLAAARNTGLDAARGELVALLDADDLCEPERIEYQVRFMQQHPELVLCCSDFSSFNAQGPVSNSHISSYYSRCSPELGGVRGRYPEQADLDVTKYEQGEAVERRVLRTYFGSVYEELALGNFVHPPTVMFRRRIIEVAGHFEQDARTVCDWDWLVRVARAGDVGYIDAPLLRYRLSASQMSGNKRTLLDSLHVAHRICARDPSLARLQPAKFLIMFGELTEDAAYATSSESATKTILLLALSVIRYRRATWKAMRILLKVIVPSPVANLIRRKR